MKKAKKYLPKMIVVIIGVLCLIIGITTHISTFNNYAFEKTEHCNVSISDNATEYERAVNKRDYNTCMSATFAYANSTNIISFILAFSCYAVFLVSLMLLLISANNKK